MEGSQRVLPKDASENACKTRHFDAKFTPQPQAAVRRARVRYGVESGFRVRQTAERISHCEGLRAAARADVFETRRALLPESHITHADALYSRTPSAVDRTQRNSRIAQTQTQAVVSAACSWRAGRHARPALSDPAATSTSSPRPWVWSMAKMRRARTTAPSTI